MQRKRVLIALALLAVVVTGIAVVRANTGAHAASYRLVPVERGDVESAVSATGTLSAVTTVQVGTQVSGKVTALFADFNDHVEKGQLIARIDPTLQQQAVRDAEANVARSEAELQRAQQEYDRNKTLFEQKVITETEFNTVQYNLAVAKAGLRSAEVSLERARQNLAYTAIYAPIDGIVIERNVEPGQTVAASLSAPQLFLIANDLARMRILASVDESDIGSIKPGQSVTFTVQAYPDERFHGVVQEVRLQSTTTENVVNYTVVVEVDNASGKLLPGMTASVDFQVAKAATVLKVPTAALRVRPPDRMLAEVGETGGPGQAQAQGSRGPAAGGPPARAQGGGSPAFGSRPGGQGGRGAGRAGGGRNAMARLWYVDAQGKLHVTRVRTGITDGTSTVVQGPEIKAGMQVIAGVTEASDDAGNSNPFQQPQEDGPGRFRRTGGF
jgi:HlyD family secretion protein